jgi:glucokinase
MTCFLAGDIGGTKTILRLVAPAGQGLQTLAETTYASAQYPHLNQIVEEFLTAWGGERPQKACLAIAGPVINQTARLTNLPWQLERQPMEAALQIPSIRLINDFAAVGYGILALGPEDLSVLQDAAAIPQQPIAVLGAGTGLGEALLVWQPGGYEVLSLEGGHTDFPARTDLEIGLLRYLQKRHGRVSVERVVSGQGIPAIYDYLCTQGFAPESPTVRSQLQVEDPAAVIARHGLAKTDPLCDQTLDLFMAAYGAEAGNLALKSLPYGGIYIAGGIAPKLLTRIQDGTFLENFLDKGRLRSLLANLRVSVVLNPKVGLIGAALAAARD